MITGSHVQRLFAIPRLGLPRAAARLVASLLVFRQNVLSVCVITCVSVAACTSISDKSNTADTGSVAASPVTANQSIRAADTIPTGTDAQAETLLVDVQSLDKTIVVDMRYRNANNFTGAPLAGYQGNHALMRREAATALARVQASLKSQGLGLKIWDAYRPVRATLDMVAWTVRVHREDLVRDGYIADKSKHNLGVAIDLTLVKLANGQELDMGTPHDEFSANAHTANATGTVAANRATLVNAMAAQKFINYDQEWWHFSFDVPNPLRFDMVVR